MTDIVCIPVVPGFTLKQDPLTDEWIATSPSGFVIRGWSQRELIEARWALWRQILNNFRVALAEVYPANSSLPNSRAAPFDSSPCGNAGSPFRLAGTG